MHLLYAPLNEPGSEQVGLTKAFKKAFGQVTVFDYRALGRKGLSPQEISQQLFSTVERTKPNIIHLQVQDSTQITAECLQAIKNKYPNTFISHWTGDVREEVSVYLSKISQVADLTLIASTGQKSLFKQAGARRVVYWQVGIDPELDIPKQEDVEKWRKTHGIKKVIFLANNYKDRFPASRKRFELAKAMRYNFGSDFGLYGASWPKEWGVSSIPYQKQGVVSASAVVTLAMNHFIGIDRWYSDRTALAIASGTCHLTHAVQGIEKEYTIGKEILVFYTIPEAIDMVSDLLGHPEKAKEIGKAGQARALKQHTWDKRVEQYLQLVEVR